MIFETKRLYVTKWKSTDLKALHEIYGDSAYKKSIVPVLTIEETKSIFDKQLSLYEDHAPFGRYFIVEKLSNKFIGLLLFRKDNDKSGVEIGYSLIENYWKKGYATEVVKESITWMFETKGFSKMYAITDPENENSKNVLLKCGFLRKENLLEDGEEMNFYSLIKEEDASLQ
jgi:ribosomal-protein-alanine N-acetyltransferase